MKDSEFRALSHPVGPHVIATTGALVATGYKPDVTITDQQGRLQFILECEQKTDRKAYLGDLIKAEMHSEQQGATPELIIVMKPFGNTTTTQIAEHLRPYRNWLSLKKNGALNLAAVQVVSDTEYLQAIAAGETIGSAQFKRRGHVL